MKAVVYNNNTICYVQSATARLSVVGGALTPRVYTSLLHIDIYLYLYATTLPVYTGQHFTALYTAIESLYGWMGSLVLPGKIFVPGQRIQNIYYVHPTEDIAKHAFTELIYGDSQWIC